MKKFKKALSLTIALAMSATMAAPAFADTLTVSVAGEDVLGSTVNVDASDATVETATEPEVLMFRDYEDLSDNETRYDLAYTLAFNQSGNFGTTKLGTNAGVGVDPVVVNGADGKGLGFNTRSSDGATSGAFASVTTNGYSTGKIYIAFDMQRKSDAELDAQDGTTDGYKMVTNAETGAEEKQYVIHDTYFYVNGGDGSTQQYGRIWTRHTNSTATTWNGTTPGHYIPDEKLHRYEYVIDLDNDTFKGYVDGVQNGNGTTYAADFVKFSMTLTNAIKYLDNFAIVHYPTNSVNTFAVTAKDIDYTDNTLVVDFDSNAQTVTDTATYTANYPIVSTSEVTSASFVVKNKAGEAVTVSSVTPADAFGSYKIALEGGLVVGETYTVAAVEGLTDVLGATVDSTKTAEFTPVAPTVLYFRDYEDYVSGGSIYTTGRGTGVNKVEGNPSLNTGSVAVTGVDGTAVDLCAGSGAPNLTMESPITSGLVYIGVDLEPYTAEEIAAGTGEADDAWFVVKSSDNNTGRYIRFGVGREPSGPWEDIARFGQLNDGYQRLEVVINLDTKKVYSYCNGVADTTVRDYNRHDFNFVSFDICSNGLKKWDNLAVVHYPTDAPNMFSIAAKGVDYENNALTVDFDNDAATTVDTTTYKANYPTILTQDITPEDVTVINLAGEAMTVSAVNKNAAFGSYDIVLEEALVDGETYTVAVSDDLESTLGGVINGTTAEVTIPQPNVFLYRDYEDYKGAAWDAYIIQNPDKVWGTWSGGFNETLRKASTKVAGPSGTAVNIGLRGGNPNANLPYTVDSGVFYLGVDVEKESDEFFDEVDGTTNGLNAEGKTVVHENYITLKDSANFQTYARFGTGHSACANSVTSWGGHDLVKIPNLSAGYHRYELVADLDANTVVTYLDGAVVGTNEYARDINHLTFQLDQGIAKWDNLAIVHYPQGVKPQTFSLQNAKADKEENTITVSLKSNTQGGTYKAPYNIYTEELTADDFVVMDADGNVLEPTSIEPGKVYGEYVITMADALVENATYTVAASAERTDALGATLDSNAAAECYVHPDVYFDLGFDGYKGEQTKFYPYTFGTQKLTHQKAAYDEKYGTGLEIDDMSTSNWPLTDYSYSLKETVNSGVLTASFDMKFNEDYNTSKANPEVSINNGMGKYGPNSNGVYYLMHMGTSVFQTYTNLNGWSATAVATHEANTWYHIDLVMDFDNRVFNAYIDGALVSSVAMPATMQAKSVKWLLHEDSVYDNLRLAYSESDSFVVTKTAWNGNYAEVLLSEGADTASLAMADDVVVTDKATGEVVEATVELAGRRVFISGLDKSKSYTVTLPENYKSVTGNTLVDTEAVIEAGTFNVTGVKVTADENGTELTADMIAELKAGDKVYAEVTYVNETGKDKTFVLFGAAYSAKRMTSANYADVTALGSVSGEAKAYVEITVDNPAEFEAKAFAVESVATMQPLK